jgi:hypothetical protein
MTLAEFAAQTKRAIFDDLAAGRPPSTGSFDDAVLRDARTKGSPQMGGTVYRPDGLRLEFVYPDPQGASVVLSVEVSAPERIVFLPVPSWVIESVWQGDVDGSYWFESQARALVDEFTAGLEPEANLEWFGPRRPKRRE